MNIWLPLIFMLSIFLLSPLCCAEISYVSDNPSFRPVYSQNFSGYVSPDEPMTIQTEIKDSNTSFFNIYAWGQDPNTTDFYLWTSPGNEVIPGLAKYTPLVHENPQIVTVENGTSNYVKPGIYTTMLTLSHGYQYATVQVYYIYSENTDYGYIKKDHYSTKKIFIPPGLKRIFFFVSSVNGTDLDLFVQRGESLPDSLVNFSYASISNCTKCGDEDSDTFLSEHLMINNPEPGFYLMTTYAYDTDDQFYTYWMGMESGNNNETGNDLFSINSAEQDEIYGKYFVNTNKSFIMNDAKR